MGISKLLKFLFQRHPRLRNVVTQFQIPQVDNLYLDMNAIIHGCSHQNGSDVNISEEEIVKSIFKYIETLFRVIQPQKLFFIAVDGVAPRAKMNQQRARRFKTAKEAKERELLEPSDDHRFDPNCITPGTEFMTRLQEQLKFFVVMKISTDKLWQKVRVILSGHDTPGEGEHKIMDYIRFMKSQPDYDPDTRHCLYGVDADLIMLGLCTHEPHFFLLREEVNQSSKYKRMQKRIPLSKFLLLHLSLMRECLQWEFYILKTTLPFSYDLENIIDDWVLMGFLVGNDFIPHLPNLHIDKGALPILYKTYIDVLPTLGGYIGEGGYLHLDRFQKYMEKLGTACTEEMLEGLEDKYYIEKLECDKVTPEVLQSLAEDYVRAIQWNLMYYCNGCCSWSWFYPHHYAPYILDIKNFSALKLEYDLGEPFLPFQQQLAVLPPASKKLLPKAYHELMEDDKSPIINFYPTEFKTDLNGKKHDWEAVVLIPFIDQESLLKAAETKTHELTEKEKSRNKDKPMLFYKYTPENLGVYRAPEYFPALANNHAQEESVPRQKLFVEHSKLVKGLCPGLSKTFLQD